MCVFRLETLEGVMEVVVFPNPYQEYAVLLNDEAPVLVCGEVTKEGELVRLRANEVYSLTEAHRYFAEKISLHVPEARATSEIFRAVRQVLRASPGDVPVVILIEFPDGERVGVLAEHTFKTSATPRVVHALEKILGEGCVYIATNPSPCLRQKKAGWERRSNGNGNGY